MLNCGCKLNNEKYNKWLHWKSYNGSWEVADCKREKCA